MRNEDDKFILKSPKNDDTQYIDTSRKNKNDKIRVIRRKRQYIDT